MALTTGSIFVGGVVHASDIIQFYNLFTGIMTDQVVTFGDGLVLSGTSGNITLNGTGGTAAGEIGYAATGKYQFGDGTTQQVANLSTWTNWTPTVNQNGAITATITEATYAIIGRLFVAKCTLTITAAGSAGHDITIGGWPVGQNPAAAQSRAVGTFRYNIAASGANRVGAVVISNATTLILQIDNNTGNFGTAPSQATANNDVFGMTIAWEF